MNLDMALGGSMGQDTTMTSAGITGHSHQAFLTTQQFHLPSWYKHPSSFPSPHHFLAHLNDAWASGCLVSSQVCYVPPNHWAGIV